MRAIFGIVSLLVVLAIVGVLASKQLKSVNQSVGSSMPPAQPGAAADSTISPAPTNVREQSQQIQQRVTSDIQKSMEQGAARNETADK